MRYATKLAVILVLLAPLAACTKPATEEAASSSGVYAEPTRSSEAEKTEELERKAAEYKDRFAEIQASDMSAEEKAQAASELMNEQQRTIQEAEDGGDSAGDGD